jgi:hypothetical protein
MPKPSAEYTKEEMKRARPMINNILKTTQATAPETLEEMKETPREPFTLETIGSALDDSIRDNDGWYYRFAEIIKAREQFKNETEILVILGPGFPGEDYQQERVPLSLIITKEGS